MTLSAELLFQATCESIHFASAAEFDGARESIAEAVELREVSVHITSDASLFRAFAEGLDFPGYFGENWDAFDESLCDLQWPRRDRPAVVAVHHAARLWKEQPHTAAHLVEGWLFAAETWRSDEVAFHLIFVW